MMQENTGPLEGLRADETPAEETVVESSAEEPSVVEPTAVSTQTPPMPVFEEAAVPERLPTMRDLDQLAIELDAIDRTLAQLDQPVASAAP